MSATDFLIGILTLIVGLGVIGTIIKKAQEHGMRVFLSGEYAVLCFGAVCALIANFFVQPPETGMIVSMGTGIVAFGIACLSNIKKSSLGFGIIFTIFQTAMVVCFALIVLAVLNWGTEKAKSL